MRYHLDTIPLWDALKAGGECPLCSLQEKLEAEQVAMTLEGAAMEPSRRIESNATGYCIRHLRALALSQRNLTLSLVLSTRTGQLRRELEPLLESAAEKDKKAAKQLSAALRAKTSGCVICGRVAAVMGRYTLTLLHLWKSDTEFRRLLESSRGFCLPHTAQLLEAAEKKLHFGKDTDFAAMLASLEKENLRRIEEELQHYSKMFDYRSKGLSWGSARDILPRAVTKLRGGSVVPPTAALEPELPETSEEEGDPAPA